MSGIVGIFHLDGSPADQRELGAMTDSIAYRGPDGVGHWVKGRLGLGHLQLCATPESLRERQPLALPDARYAVVCDGRVDNRDELIYNLRRLSPITPDATDVDLILSAYRAWDVDCVKRIAGDFAFAIWDGLRQRLFCARDRLGMRPFYYYHDHRRFLFASETNPLLQCSGVPRRLNETVVGFYLTGGFGDGEQTFYSGIRQLPPGHFLLVTGEGVAKERYWELEADNPVILGSDEEYGQRFLELFQEAVRCRSRSITPVAITLSGGLDSSSIACTASALAKEGMASSGPPAARIPGRFPDRIQCFSAVFEEFASADESPYIRAVCDKWRLRSHLFNADAYWGLKPLSGTYPHPDHPFPVVYQARDEAMLRQMRDAGIGVALTGEGGDDVLYARPASYFHHLLAMRRWAFLYRELKRVTPRWRRGFYRQAALSLAPGWLRSLRRRAQGPESTTGEDYSLLTDDFTRRNDLDARLREIYATREFKSPYEQDQYAVVQWFGRHYFTGYYAQLALWHGIEVRFPFLDARLVDFICRAPPEQKVARHGFTKALLRHSMTNILPESVRQRPDKGDFSPLFSRGLELMGESGLNQYVENGCLTEMGFVDKSKLSQLYSAASSGQSDAVSRLICFISLETWLQQLFGSRGGGIPVEQPLPTIA